MDIGAIVSRARKAAADNTPTILTALGVTGTLATAVLVGKASFKAAEVLAQAEKNVTSYEDGPPLDNQEKFNLVWKLYIPAATTGAVTLACIITANRVSSRRAAALASAYSISQEAFREYKDKVVEKIGEKKEQAVRDEIAQAHVEKNPAGPLVLIDSKILCYDTHSGRYFQSDLETIRKAINDVNWQILNECYASVTDFWDKIGLTATKDSDEIGWNMDTKFEVQYSAALSDDGKPVLAIDFHTVPVRGYYKING
jgi:uncharacterized protein DUF6353